MPTTPATFRPHIVLVLGGAASGKSEFAERYAVSLGGSVCYVATAEPGDEEMRCRIERHKARRPPEWRTREVTRDLASHLTADSRSEIILVESLGMVLANHMAVVPQAGFGPLELRGILRTEIGALVGLSASWKAVLIVVSEEVGLSLVPLTPFARGFSEQLGWCNQHTAALADEVYLVVAGISIRLKPQ
ncbi:MAG: bifunctional adenosylcobinamide kinase/adenosylcobinamide-phosphate guanylyltransferase [Kofleriaceae bacterium]|nr:bifunctional adenosylcobinamide kinase/adenosylcobinamide-phosphate guanylyltransferase [Candidatus Methylomirabilis lanthanidiphila]